MSAVVDAETRVALRRRAAAADRSISAEVRRALRWYLTDQDQHEHDDETHDLRDHNEKTDT